MPGLLPLSRPQALLLLFGSLLLAALTACAAEPEAISPSGDNNDLVKDFDTVVRVLVKDFLTVSANPLQQTHVKYDSLPYSRIEREIKDRYELLYQEAVRSAGIPSQASDFPASDLENSFAESEWLPVLREAHRASFVATRANWRDLLKKMDRGLEKDFLSGAANLRASHELLRALEPPPPQCTGSLFFLLIFPSARRVRPDDFSFVVAVGGSFTDVAIDEARLPTRSKETEIYFKMFNVTYLPTVAEVYEMFPWLHPEADRPKFTEGDISETPQERFITSAPFTYFFSNHLNKVCEIFTQEYIRGLARYLGHRVTSILQADPKLTSVSVAEIGAGNGRLSHFLRVFLDELPGVKGLYQLVATDLAGNIGDFARMFPVEGQDHKQTLRKWRPQLVICSWMTMQVDLTHSLRTSKYVQEYVLIGEIDYGVSGKALETWGLGGKGQKPLYTKEGFQRIALENLSLLQLARSDSPYVQFHSQTTVFRRPPPTTKSHEEL